MSIHEVQWVKTYHTIGTVFVEAEDGDEAEDIVREKIGGLEGCSMQYDPSKDHVSDFGDDIDEGLFRKSGQELLTRKGGK